MDASHFHAMLAALALLHIVGAYAPTSLNLIAAATHRLRNALVQVAHFEPDFAIITPRQAMFGAL